VTTARLLVSILSSCTLVACATQTIETSKERTVRTAVGSEAPTVPKPQSLHGYRDGEILISFTPEGEKAIKAAVAQAPGKLRFGIPSLDRLNAKYKASQLVKMADVQGAYLLRLAPDANVFRAVDEYGKDPLVAGTEPHYFYRLPAAEAPGAVRMQTGPLERAKRPGSSPAR